MFKWFHGITGLLKSINGRLEGMGIIMKIIDTRLERLEATVGKDEKSGDQTFIRTGPRQTR